jgi:signal recognition particle GTPase
MVKTSLIFGAGLLFGAGAVALMLSPNYSHESVHATPVPQVLSCDRELAEARQRVSELENKVSAVARRSENVAPTYGSGTETPQPPQSETSQQEVISWRISAIEKFVPLSEEQRSRLSAKFEEEQRAKAAGEEPHSEALEEILGQENASFYRNQVKAAFQRMESEENEKEVVWLSRQLTLSDVQEQSMRSVFSSVEQTIEREQGATQNMAAGSPQERVKRMIAENKRRSELRAEQLKPILSPEQYQAYLRSQAESSASDVEVFHDPGK